MLRGRRVLVWFRFFHLRIVVRQSISHLPELGRYFEVV
jgi:hypothetical protein